MVLEVIAHTIGRLAVVPCAKPLLRDASTRLRGLFGASYRVIEYHVDSAAVYTRIPLTRFLAGAHIML